MKIGILNFVAESTVDPATLGQKCEALGFESLFLAEHPIVPTHYTRADGSRRVPDGKTPEVLCRISDLFVSLSFAAAVDDPPQTRHRHLPGSGATAPAAGQGSRHPRPLLQGQTNLRYRRRMARRRVRGDGRGVPPPMAGDA